MSIWDKPVPPSNEGAPTVPNPRPISSRAQQIIEGTRLNPLTPEEMFSRSIERYISGILPSVEEEAEKALHELRTFNDPESQEQRKKKWESDTIISDAATISAASDGAFQQRLDAKREEILQMLRSTEELRDLLRCMNEAFLKAEKNPETAIQLLEAEAKALDRKAEDLEAQRAPRDQVEQVRLKSKRYYSAANKIDDLRRYAH
jgi:hypothetical protein